MVLDEGWLAVWVERMRREELGAVAVLLKGSYARGAAGPYSDLDLDVLTRGEPRVPYRAYLEEISGRLLHISVATEELEKWLAEEEEPATWSWHLPAAEATKLVWSEKSVRDHVDRSALRRPRGGMELEDFIEGAGKVRSALAADDKLQLRLAAQDLARLCPSLLIPLNPPVVAGTRTEALRLVLDLPVVPPEYKEHMLVCLGLSGRAMTMEEVADHALRLVRGVVRLLSEHSSELPPETEPELQRYLVDGTLERYLSQ